MRTTVSYTSPHRDGYHQKRKTVTSVGGDVETRPDGGSIKWCSPFGKQPGSSLKCETYSLVLERNENICPHKNLYMKIDSYIIYYSKKCKQSKCPSNGEWINKCGISKQ